MAFPVSHLATAALLFDIPGRSCLRVLLLPGFQLISLVAVITGFGLWEMRRWAWHLFLATCLLVAYFNAILVLEYGETHHRALAFFTAILALLGVLIRTSRELRVPYFLPRIRWWESNPRYKLSAPGTISRAGDGTQLPGEVLDLSIGGCFVKLRSDLNQDEDIRIRFTLFGQSLELPGKVVWRTQSAVTHPKGVGIKFSQPDRPQRKVLKAMLQRLREISNLYRTSRFLMGQEEFSAKIESLRNTPLKLPPQKIPSP